MRWILCAVALHGCTRRNLAFNGPGAGAGGDASVADLAVAEDLRQSVADLSSSGDLASGDLAVPGVDLGPCTNGCIYGGACVAMGQPCGAGRICSASGCQACGAPSQPCCAGDACGAGGCCVSNLCAGSGSACATPILSQQQVCLDGSCQSCGAVNQPCCANHSCAALTPACCDVQSRICVGLGSSCGTATCGLGSSCGGCGGTTPGNTCCPPENPGLPSTCSAGGTTCVNGNSSDSCQACGANGQPCCDGNSCADGGCCDSGTCRKSTCTTSGGACVAGACQGGTCGGAGQPCCASGVCTAPFTRCLSQGAAESCQPCGGKDQRCCDDPSSGTPIDCARPYGPKVDNSNTCYCRT